MSIMEDLWKKLINYIKVPTMKVTLIFTIIDAILFFNPQIIEDFSLNHWFEEKNYYIFSNFSEYLFHNYLLLVTSLFYIILFIAILFLLLNAFFRSFNNYFNNFLSVLYKLTILLWKVGVNYFVLFFLYYECYYGKRFINSIRFPEERTERKLIGDSFKNITTSNYVSNGYGSHEEGTTILMLLIINIIIVIVYSLYLLFKEEKTL